MRLYVVSPQIMVASNFSAPTAQHRGLISSPFAFVYLSFYQPNNIGED